MKLNSFEYNAITYFLIRASFVGLCINNLLETAKQDCWISIVLGIIIGILPFFMYQKININNKYVLYPITVFTFFYCSLILWNLINFVKAYYLYNTPSFVIGGAFIIAILFLISKGIKIIGRVSTILIWFSLFLLIINITGLWTDGHIDNIRPILEGGINPVLTATFNYTCYSILPLFFLNNIESDKKNSLKFYILGNLTLLAIMLIFLTNYGIKLSLLFDSSEFHVLKRISFAPFLERLEHFIFIEWIFDIFIFLVMGIYFICNNIKKDSTKPSILVSIIILFLSLNLFENNIIVTMLNKYIPIMLFTFFFVIPLFHYLCCYKNDKNNHNCCSNK